MFSYPDVVVICGDIDFHDAFGDVILNPTAIFEVLSPSTELFDRGDKFLRYQSWNPTLKEYVLISQSKPLVERYARSSDGRWEYEVIMGLESQVSVPSIRCEMKLADLYDRVTFPDPLAPVAPPPPLR